MKWINIKDELPKVDTRVQINYVRHSAFTGKDYQIQTYAVYEDGTMPEEDSNWIGNGDDWLYYVGAEYDEANDRYLIPAGWYEVLTCNGSEYCCSLDANEKVTHWMPSPEPPKEE